MNYELIQIAESFERMALDCSSLVAERHELGDEEGAHHAAGAAEAFAMASAFLRMRLVTDLVAV